MRGLGGSLLYFVDPKSQLGRLWDIDFTAPKQPQGNGGAGLTAIDHISQSMQYEEMLSWLLFYNSLLDVTKTPQLDVIDPGGIVRSQVIQTADGALRIALNASQSQQTLSSRFLTHYFGSGVQHIAFATGDIVATVKRLRANGVELLPMPENYYDDLEARTDLPPSGSTCCAPTTSSTTATRRANTSRPTPANFEGCSSSRSSSAGATRASARSTPRSGWPRRRGKPIVAMTSCPARRPD